MKKFIIPALLLIFGIWYGQYFGGILTGIATTIILFMTIGKIVATKSMKKIDQQMEDFARVKAAVSK